MFKSIKRLSVAVFVIAASAAFATMAAPAEADVVPETTGVGVATGFVHANGATTIACTKSSGYTFQGVAIQGVTLGRGDDPLIGSTDLNPQPSGPADPGGTNSGDPLNGTPLGCQNSGPVPSLGVALAGPGGPIPVGTPLLGCPAAEAPCSGGPGTSNVFAGEGVVAGAGAPDFSCTGVATTIPNIPPTSSITCNLHGTFVRYGGAVLVFLTGCVDVRAVGGPACTYTTPTEDVTVAAQVVPLPLNTACNAPSTGFECSALAGPYVITKRGTPFGAGGAVQTVLDLAYCPLKVAGLAAHTDGLFPPKPDCR